VPFEYEVIVVDDGSSTRETVKVCEQYPIHYCRIEREPVYRNPSVARNVAYRKAVGEVIICQSDDVYHSPDAIRRLTEELQPGEFLIATVWNVNERGIAVRPKPFAERFKQLTGRQMPRPLFFLGSLWRSDLYAIGGNDEEFTKPGREDVWFAECLIHGLHLTPRYSDVEGYHQDHSRPSLTRHYEESKMLYQRKRASGLWQASGGAWQA
jgi:glycosyltransferase involved in cell wall biosynthesis